MTPNSDLNESTPDSSAHSRVPLIASLHISGIAPADAQAWAARLPDAYHATFSTEMLISHIALFSRITEKEPIQYTLMATDGDEAILSLFVPDYPGMLAAIAGALSANGCDIISGDTYTLTEKSAEATPAAQPSYQSAHQPSSGMRLRHPLRRTVLQKNICIPIQDRKLVFAQLRIHMPAASQKPESEVVNDVLALITEHIRLREEGKRDEARATLNQAVADHLATQHHEARPVLLPVELDIDHLDADPCIRLTIVGQDTPAFLYAIANALSLRKFYIQRIHIETRASTACDTIWLCEENGSRPDSEPRLRELRIAALLTKQFTHFLVKAPDPYKALSHFDHLLDHILADPKSDSFSFFQNPESMARLAQLLGASDFLWEDFIRLQYESILPALAGADAYTPIRTRLPLLDQELKGLHSFEEKVVCINRFKDRETARTDMAHILQPDFGFSRLGDELSEIADAVIQRIAALAYEKLSTIYGEPRVVGDAPCPYAVFGLGKLGGQELGYASDLELLLVYSDQGETAGPQHISNAEFFNRHVETLRDSIFSSRNGIYEIDLRLRPHGTAGPLAASLESVVAYYSLDGGALDYERLALTRMRTICGDATFAAHVCDLRDDLVFHTRSIDFEAVKELRIKQYEHKGAGENLNAKFSAGGLVDIEYAVQMLQVEFGAEQPDVRHTGTLHTLDALEKKGCIASDEFLALREAYRFLRTLINGLRMLRGHAKDLEIPHVEDPEFAHLARRMGYEPGVGFSPAEQLQIDIERHMAVTRASYRMHFGQGARLSKNQANAADLVLSDDIPDEAYTAVFHRLGLKNHTRAKANFKSLSGYGAEKASFARLAVVLRTILPNTPDPDMALNNFNHFADAVTSRLAFYELLLAQPRKLDLLFRICGTSNYLSHTLRRNPELFDGLTAPEALSHPHTPEEMEADLQAFLRPMHKKDSRLRMLRRFRNRETLRIGIRDLCLNAPFTETVAELSDLADILIQASLAIELEVLTEEHPEYGFLNDESVIIFAFGKLGGRELNYSSDIDLAAVYDAPEPDPIREKAYTMLTEGMIRNLDRNTDEGYVYRIDMRLRPHGRTAPLVIDSGGWNRYYAEEAALWELQALLKVRPVAGSIPLGMHLLDTARARLLKPDSPENIAKATGQLRDIVLKNLVRARSTHHSRQGFEVKNGPGGIRDIEFGIQVLQRIHAPTHPTILASGTLEAIENLRTVQLLKDNEAKILSEHYIFLRRIEHILQIMDDQQLHILKETPEAMTVIGAIMPDKPSADDLRAQLLTAMEYNRSFFLNATTVADTPNPT